MSSKKKTTKPYSIYAVILLSFVVLSYRTYYSDLTSRPLKVTTWDALGYYQYLPATFIYNDVDKLDWFEEKEAEYDLSNGYIYQFSELTNGNRVGKYYCGVAIMESPFFLLAHLFSSISTYEQDGFSPPYQYSLAYGVILYFILSLFILRRILLHYFNELVTAITLLILVLGTNLIQYTAIEGTLSHSFIFLLYTLLIYFTIKWHENQTNKNAILIGAIVGFSIMCRPTEAVMIFIPLLWGIKDRKSGIEKWNLLVQNKKQVIFTALAAFIAFLPQLFYWHYVTGSFIHNVGSKWMFLNPWFRVLLGFEKGWFIYTPITIFFVLGLFYIKKFPFKNAVIWFSILNIWIIISWHEWRYGASYSTRALVQSYPIFALSLAAFISKIIQHKLRIFTMVLGIYLVFVKLFQIMQYNRGILLVDGMNLSYYKAVYLKTNPPAEVKKLATPTPNN